MMAGRNQWLRQCHVAGGSGRILMNGDEAWQAEAHLVLRPQSVARALWRGQRHINASWRTDQVVMYVEAMTEHDVLAIANMRLNLVGPKYGSLVNYTKIQC